MTVDQISTFIGVDVGGTHTDVVVIRGGQVHHGKAATTPADLSVGVVDGIEVVARELGVPAGELLTGARRVVNGTTVVTNALTQLRGRRVGVIVTKGFRDTFRIARGARLNLSDDHQQHNPPPVVAWDDIIEVRERLDYAGEVVSPLDEDAVREAAQALVEHGVEAIAITFLWSFVNPDHELRAKAIVEAEFPGRYVVTSAEVYPLSREFERWNTAVFTAFVQQDVVTYAQGLESKLLALGLSQGHLSLFQCLGGALEPAEASAAPLQLMDSGPVGGVIAAKRLAALLGPEGNLICADMGGTSFDLALLRGGDFTYSKRRALGDPAYVTGLSSVDIVSIGAGGGSIAWSDRRGIPQVGPMSAGAVPGPACYGAGGTAPTVTDAMVVMGFIEPGQFLGGRRKLDLEAARTAVSTLGATAGWTPEQTAAGIHDIAVANMINALREVSVQKGHDPRDFTMLAYGGMTPLFAWTVAAGAGIGTVVIPPHAAAFSAWGVVLADHVRRYEQTVDWNLDDPERVHDINTTVDTLVARALADAARAGFAESEVEITRSGSFRFLGQVWEIDLPIELRRFTAQDAPALKEAFIRRYEEIYGRGTAWKGSAVVLLDYSVTATGREATPEFPPWTSGTAAPSRRDTRRVFDPSSRSQVEFAVYDEDDLGVGASLAGPAIIDGGDTTILVPIGVRGSRDARGNLVLAADDAMQERSGQVA